MAMPQRDDTIEAIKRLDALLEYAVMHGDAEEAERLREELRKLADGRTGPTGQHSDGRSRQKCRGSERSCLLKKLAHSLAPPVQI